MRSISEINKRIRSGDAVVLTDAPGRKSMNPYMSGKEKEDFLLKKDPDMNSSNIRKIIPD